MKNNTIKAFTLVEMLIVIVIIGILIASLMPRMQTAQGRARDVARKNDLSQIQTAIITSQSDRGERPQATAAKAGTPVSTAKQELLNAWMSEVPSDPNDSNVNYWLGTIKAAADANNWQYLYYVWKRNWVSDAGFVLMAKTEVEWSSNWVVCGKAADANKDLAHGYITDAIDLSTITLCKSVTKGAADGSDCVAWAASNWNWECKYAEAWDLRYILLY